MSERSRQIKMKLFRSEEMQLMQVCPGFGSLNDIEQLLVTYTFTRCSISDIVERHCRARAADDAG